MLWFLYFPDIELDEPVRINLFHGLLLAQCRTFSFICLLYVYDLEFNGLCLFVIMVIVGVTYFTA